MDSKKLQAFQQANSHMAPHTKPPTMQHYHEVRPSRSPVFQNHPQYQSLASNFAHINLTNNPHDAVKAQGLQHISHLEYQDQMFHSANPEKLYLHQTRLGANFPGVHQQQPSSLRLQHQFHALEQEKIQQQIRTQNEALMHQQHTFAMRQQINPPVSNFPMKSQTSSMSNMSSLNNVPQQLQKVMLHNRALPPSSLNLNLSGSYDASQSPSKLNNNNHSNNSNINLQMQQIQMLQNERQRVQQIQYQSSQKAHQQSQQLQKCQEGKTHHSLTMSPSDVPMIQQNIPGQVVNQAVQTQLTGSSIKSKSPESSSTTPSTPATPTHISSTERRKNEPVHTLKSPVAKRHPNAPVTLSGWLWKQGSEGLKVWRKRWFVLSEYCLFYYKGPEEERIMGSVLLPSYKISVCTPDDKSNRKFSFKCEHINMRTYILAAENLEFMTQWVKALTMASMMQGSSESESQPSITSYNPSGKSFGENSADSGIQTFQSQFNKSSNIGPVTPASDNSVQNYQPLYANAPPKPRRVTDYGYSSPSPENAFDQYNQVNMRQDVAYAQKLPGIHSLGKATDVALLQRMQQMHLERNVQPAENAPSNYSSKQRNVYEQDQYMQKLIMHQQQLQQQQKYMETLASLNSNRMHHSLEENKSLTHKTGVDYEDIYNMGKVQDNSQKQLFDAYKRPLSPVKHDVNSTMPYNTLNFFEDSSGTYKKSIRDRQSSNFNRPHSADFLEYEARNPVVSRKVSEFSQVPRPKSSLDINRTPDNAYYSESNYAEKMRQSALYLQKQNYTMPLGKTYSQRVEEIPSVNSQKNQREKDMFHNRFENSFEMQNPMAPSQDGSNNVNEKNQFINQQDFIRSSSVRLPKKEDEGTGLDCERKREESMKRLLEWKQRMLQSPLTRKGTHPTNSFPSASKSSIASLNQKAYFPHQSFENSQKSNHPLQRCLSDSQTGILKNEDSSGDEDESCTHGRSSSCNTKAHESALLANNEKQKLNSLNQSDSNDKSKIKKFSQPLDAIEVDSSEMQTNNSFFYTPVYSQNYVSSVKSNFVDAESKEKVKKTAETEMQPLDNSDHSTCNKNIDSCKNDEEQFEYTDSDLNEALAEDSNAEDDKKDDLSEINDFNNLEESLAESEGHYLPMVPKKALMSSSASETSILTMDVLLNSMKNTPDAIEENPYIEMTKGLSSDRQSSAYELVIVSNKKNNPEPLYMELVQNASGFNQKEVFPINSLEDNAKLNNRKKICDKGNSKKRYDLPDILKQSQNFIKSESSSDEESETATMKSRTRFSLSDTFRPASYYLGGKMSNCIQNDKTLAECIDSSDSEIVAPPPIPSTSPPDTNEIFSSEIFNTIKRNNTTSNSEIKQRRLSSSSNQLGEKQRDINTSRFSLQEQLLKQQPSLNSLIKGYTNLQQFESLQNARFLSSASNCSINTDDSNTSSDFDLYNKITLQSPSISADSLNQLQTLNGRSVQSSNEQALLKSEEKNANINLDHYLNNLEKSDVSLCKEKTWLTESFKHMENSFAQDSIANTIYYEQTNIAKNQSKRNDYYYDSLEDIKNKSTAEKNYNVKNEKICTPVHENRVSQQINEQDNDSAPYYYSDLTNESIETLNNQRILNSAKKNSNISHIHNNIENPNKQQPFIMFNEQKLNNNKSEGATVAFQNDFANNKIYYQHKTNNTDAIPFINESSKDSENLSYTRNENMSAVNSSIIECDRFWEEDAIWRESLRRVSQRHARSLDDLNSVEEKIIDKKSNLSFEAHSNTNNDVIYNNDQIEAFDFRQNNREISNIDEDDVYVQLACSSMQSHELATIDRENIRRWDLLSQSGMSNSASKSYSTDLKMQNIHAAHAHLSEDSDLSKKRTRLIKPSNTKGH